MSLAVGIPVAISAVRALIKYRGRVDQILALKEASEAIPFSLPPAPFDFQAQKAALFAFFESDEGQLVLELRGRAAAFRELRADHLAPATHKLRNEFAQLFFEASDTAPVVVGPQAEARSVRASEQMRLSYYVVASHRLSRNPALTRLLLATADTLLEVAGPNAGLFVSNPKTRAIVAALIDDFAGQRDFDDDGAELLLRGLLRSAVVAALEHQDEISEEPAVAALFSALSELREDFGDDFVARILTRRGFQALVGRYLTQVAEDPSFLVEDGPLRTVLGATLRDLGENFVEIFDDPKALFGVLDTALTIAAGESQDLLAKKLGGEPLLSVVLQSVLGEINARAASDGVLRTFARGEVVGDLFRASMAAIAASPGELAKAARIDELSTTLVAGLADILANEELASIGSAQTLRSIVSRSFTVLAEHSAAWAGDSEFVTNLAVSVLDAASSALVDGLSSDDLTDLLDAALESSAADLHLLALDGRVEVVLAALGEQLSENGVRALLAPRSRGDVILSTLQTVAQNPVIWDGFAEADLVQPLVAAVFQGLATDRTELLTGPGMVEGLRTVLTALARRGQALLEAEVDVDDVEQLLTLGLRKLVQEVGRGVDAQSVPGYLFRLVDFFLDDPFVLDKISDPDFKALHELAMDRAEVVLAAGDA